MLVLAFGAGGGSNSSGVYDSNHNCSDDLNEPYRDVYPDEGIYWDEYKNDFKDNYYDD
ncbi:hypothetical protein [Lentilactobacillus kosonis]|uniref:Uncharacterized protein n=1 Tax=Lentilactobacillus kosonis TaxID=2810561 RepID=A0A401FJ72_9LACO|nr:hypothetical protein [Lentilactobacillus kosonis]GAY72424.1 hypothetical protein NBRC111893_570 [Lentilactobacillus kosonis]